MIGRVLGLLALALLLVLPSAVAVGGHYVPQAGDQFEYAESWLLDDGTGNYTGYFENSAINGTVAVTAVAANGTESARYYNADRWSNVTGAAYSWTSSGTFTFSAATFAYVDGTDNQTGYTNPFVWFYMNNSLPDGASFELLNTPMTVQSRDYAYPLVSRPNTDVETINATGGGSFFRNDIYGAFTADYNWSVYFDPGTGYIVGYLYTEHDFDGPNGFEITDSLYVTSTSYPLTDVAPPTSSSGTSALSELEVVLLVVVVVVIIVGIVVVLIARSRRSKLPRHSGTGAVNFGPAAMPPPTGTPPPVHLTPSGQPAVQQIVIKETVKVPCRYCGTLIDSTATVCPVCGAPRT